MSLSHPGGKVQETKVCVLFVYSRQQKHLQIQELYFNIFQYAHATRTKYPSPDPAMPAARGGTAHAFRSRAALCRGGRVLDSNAEELTGSKCLLSLL